MQTDYTVTVYGDVISYKGVGTNGKPRNLVHVKDTHGYHMVNLYIDGKHTVYKVHRLVAENFIANPDDKPQVNHIDGNKDNNNMTNLEWCTEKRKYPARF